MEAKSFFTIFCFTFISVSRALGYFEISPINPDDCRKRRTQISTCQLKDYSYSPPAISRDWLPYKTVISVTPHESCAWVSQPVNIQITANGSNIGYDNIPLFISKTYEIKQFRPIISMSISYIVPSGFPLIDEKCRVKIGIDTNVLDIATEVEAKMYLDQLADELIRHQDFENILKENLYFRDLLDYVIKMSSTNNDESIWRNYHELLTKNKKQLIKIIFEVINEKKIIDTNDKEIVMQNLLDTVIEFRNDLEVTKIDLTTRATEILKELKDSSKSRIDETNRQLIEVTGKKIELCLRFSETQKAFSALLNESTTDYRRINLICDKEL